MIHEQQVAFSGERTIALRLTNDQVRQILSVLNYAQSDAKGRRVEQLQALQEAVVEASSDYNERVQCEVCETWFTSEAGRRPARYCSASCKQKAYRSRLARREQV